MENNNLVQFNKYEEREIAEDEYQRLKNLYLNEHNIP